MKKVFIRDIKEKDHIGDSFLVARKDTGISKSGKPYLNLKIIDSSGEMDARVWDDAEEAAKKFQKDDVCLIKGFAVAYLGGLQISVTDIRRLPEDGYSIRDYLPSSKRDPVDMASELDGTIARVTNRHLKALLTSIFNDPEIRRRFLIAPAAKAMHHPYVGGLVEHTLSMCGLAEKVSGHYCQGCNPKTGVNKDLLTAGALLHDIGKIYELSYQRSFDYTDEGRLLGHITIGVELVDEKIREASGFPRELAVLLKHMILSHHGQLQFGSPKRPKTTEAMILSYLDDMDAKVAAVSALGANPMETGSNWTAYQKIFERAIYKGGVPSDEEAPADNDIEGAPGFEAVKKTGPDPDNNIDLDLFKKLI